MGRSKPQLRKILGQPSWRIANDQVEAYLTEQGGHLGPITFDRSQRRIQPLSIAPWFKEKHDTDLIPVLNVLRGDFFCLPFGLNPKPYRGKIYPVHGETANRTWVLESFNKSSGCTTLHTSMTCSIRAGRVDKRITLIDGHNAVYCEHHISGMSGKMPVGHHAMLKFPAGPHSGHVSTSLHIHAQVLPHPMERPEERGYSCLKPGAVIASLQSAPTVTGESTDLTLYPARRGFEDLFVVVSDPQLPFAWSAATFSKQRYVWFSLKNPRLLRQTNFWLSNGGRHYAPWKGRHIDVMGIEEVTSYFDCGLYESSRSNDFTRLGHPTSLHFRRDHVTRIPYVMGVASIPPRFDRVQRIDPSDDGRAVALISHSGRSVSVSLRLAFITPTLC